MGNNLFAILFQPTEAKVLTYRLERPAKHHLCLVDAHAETSAKGGSRRVGCVYWTLTTNQGVALCSDKFVKLF